MNIKQQISRLANKIGVNEQELYESSQMLKYLQAVSDGLMQSERKIELQVYADAYMNQTAGTDGNKIIINASNDLVRFYSTPEKRFEAFMGMFYHEHAHIRYLDFDLDNVASARIASGEFYGDKPVPATKEEADNLAELEDAMKRPEFRVVLSRLWHTLCNVADDPHDERKIIEEYGRTVEKCINRTLYAMWQRALPVETIEEMLADGSTNLLGAVLSVLLHYVRYEEFFVTDEATLKTSQLVAAVREVAYDADMAVWTDSTYERYSYLNNIVLKLWPYVKAEMNDRQQQQQQNGQSQQNGSQGQSQQNSSGSGNSDNNNSSGDGSENSGNNNPVEGGADSGNNLLNGKDTSMPENISADTLQSILEQLDAAAEAVQNGSGPVNCSSSTVAVSNRIKADKGEQEGSATEKQSFKPSESEDDAGDDNSALNQIAQSVAEEKAGTELEKQAAKELEAEAKKAVAGKFPGTVKVNRVTAVSERDKQAYASRSGIIKASSKRLQKKIREIMKDMKEGDLRTNLLFGDIICAEDAYRPDKRFFGEERLPADLPDMAVSLLIDHSGSMDGYRIEAAMNAAILLHDFATGIGIPVSVAGHRADWWFGNDLVYTVYADFDQYTDKDKYRLCQMRATGCNRDGTALEIAAKHLLERSESVKLLIIISDGEPSAYDSREEGVADVKDVVKRYSRKGVEIIAAAIGDDKAQIQEIYGNGFLDVSDLNKLPDILCKLLKKRLLKAIY